MYPLSVMYSLKVFLISVFLRIMVVRGLVRPTGSVAGLIIAISIPAELPHRKVFVSYYFESAFGEPTQPSDIIPGPFKQFLGFNKGRNGNSDLGAKSTEIDTDISQNGVNNEDDILDETNEDADRKLPASLLSRRHFYELFENRLGYAGLNASACLHRLICEVNHFAIGGHNGVLGDVLQIMFTPSTSKDLDILPDDYHEAEMRGKESSCEAYKIQCSSSLLDLVTKQIDYYILGKDK